MTIGEGKMVRVELVDGRLAMLDLDCDEDWGDIRITPKFNGNEETIELGNDEEGWIEVVRYWEKIELEGNCEDIIDEKFDTYAPISKDDFIEMVLIREIAYCDGMSNAEHKELMEEYGFKYENLYIPNEWKKCAPDYDASIK